MSAQHHWASIWGNAMSIAENRPEHYAKNITICYPIILIGKRRKLHP